MAKIGESGKSAGDGASESAIMKQLPIIGIVLVALIGGFTLRDYLSFQTLADNRDSLLMFRNDNYVVTALAYIGAYIAIVGFSLPGATIATLAGGFLFGTFAGALFTLIGATAGAIVIFLAASYGFGKRLSEKMDASDGMVHRIKAGLDENQWSMLFLMRLIPAVPFFVANLLPAFVNVPLWRFAVTTFFGIMPGTLVYSSVGAGLGEVFERGETPNLGIIFAPEVLLPILGLCVLAALPMILKAVRGKKGL